MKTDKIIWGLVLVFVGGILLLQNFNVIDFQWRVIWRFWPLILILIGANMLVTKDDSRAGAWVSVVLTVAALAFVGWKGSSPPSAEGAEWSFEEEREEPVNTKTTSAVYNETFTAGTRKAVLNITGGATSYVISDTTAQLFLARVNSKFGNYSLKKVTKDSLETLDFKMSGKGDWNMGDRVPNRASIALNPIPDWEINVETGAGKADLDLSAFRVNSFNFEGGATKLSLKLGQPLAETKVNIETGVSKIRILIPRDAACRIKTDSGLSLSNFQGFNKEQENTYVTPNFNQASKKIIINFEGGLSKFEVDRY
ncbi:LiaI-LiaF-like domain-containing protein [Arcticibacter sp. MXS-1]|uniref:LiaI-LiaF-like domain-containing protein n=1 Tax=Arcticibacter sp. MXS-1 TaxID=3341726 RepID=UPI0035A8EEAD